MVGADAFDHIAVDGPGACEREHPGQPRRRPGRGSCSCAIASSRPAASAGTSRQTAARVWGLDGKSLIVAIVRDIEDRVRLERRLAEEMGNLRSIVELISAGVMLTDRDLRVIVVNREVLNIHGLTEKDLVGRPVTETVGTASRWTCTGNGWPASTRTRRGIRDRSSTRRAGIGCSA